MAHKNIINKIQLQLKDECENNKLNGKVTIEIGKIECVVKSKSGIGNLVEEWFGEWLTKRGFEFKKRQNTQEFPDYYIQDGKNNKYPLEVKCFDITANPNFDVAQFEAFIRKISKDPQDLECDYLIIAYRLKEEKLILEDAELKKLWHITTSQAKRPVRVQAKQETIHNIRPCNWRSSRSKFKPFNSKAKFLEAMNNLIQNANQVEDEDIKRIWKNNWKKWSLISPQ